MSFYFSFIHSYFRSFFLSFPRTLFVVQSIFPCLFLCPSFFRAVFWHYFSLRTLRVVKVEGRQCDKCIPEHWGINSGIGMDCNINFAHVWRKIGLFGEKYPMYAYFWCNQKPYTDQITYIQSLREHLFLSYHLI